MSISTSGTDPVTITIATDTSTSNTTNTTSPNPNSIDRTQQFAADLIGQVDAGVRVDTFGLDLVTTKTGGGIVMTNDGTVTTDQAVDALRLDGNGGALTYTSSITGVVSNTNTG